MKDLKKYIFTDKEIVFESELIRNPYSLKIWFRYLENSKDIPTKRRHVIFERALKRNPQSFKLWQAYLKDRRMEICDLQSDHPACHAMNNTYERALVFLHKMPRIWLEYLDFLIDQKFVTASRRVFNRALRSLPIAQHDRIWPLCLKFLRQPTIPTETVCRVYERYLQFKPNSAEDYITFLKGVGHWNTAAQKLSRIVNDDSFRSSKGKTRYQLWLELCDLITKHPNDIKSLKVDNIIRHGIREFTNEVGRLWISLADYYIRRGLFEFARDIFEESMTTVTNIKDFWLIFDTYIQFEECLLKAKIDAKEKSAEKKTTSGIHKKITLLEDNDIDLDQRITRLEFLIERRTELLSSVLLRQNPHNVLEWHKRVKIFANNPTKQIVTYSEALCTIDPLKATGKTHSLWTSFARLYEDRKEILNSRIIFKKATTQSFRCLDDLVELYCHWLEMELRQNNYRTAIKLLHNIMQIPEDALHTCHSKSEELKLPLQKRIFGSLKLLNMLSDLEESFGTLESTRAVYYRMMDIRVCTPQTITNFAQFLREKEYVDEAFCVYERGLSLFRFPHSKDIWHAYLSRFIEKYHGTKLERTRNLFDQVLKVVSSEECKPFYLKYAVFEENYGLVGRAMRIYNASTRAVPVEQRLSVYELYAKKASEYFSVAKVREVYESAIDAEEPYAMIDRDTMRMCLSYARLEQKLGEIDRARAIFIHGSQYADPNTDKSFWNEWDQFEVKHGNEDTFRDMLRIMRTVEASYSSISVIDSNIMQHKNNDSQHLHNSKK